MKARYLIERMVRKDGVKWRICFEPVLGGTLSIIGDYPTKRKALIVARLLAGRCADVVIVKDLRK